MISGRSLGSFGNHLSTRDLLFTRYQHFVLPLRRRRERETGEIEGNRTRLRHPEAYRSPSTNFRRLDARYKAETHTVNYAIDGPVLRLPPPAPVPVRHTATVAATRRPGLRPRSQRDRRCATERVRALLLRGGGLERRLG